MAIIKASLTLCHLELIKTGKRQDLMAFLSHRYIQMQVGTHFYNLKLAALSLIAWFN